METLRFSVGGGVPLNWPPPPTPSRGGNGGALVYTRAGVCITIHSPRPCAVLLVHTGVSRGPARGYPGAVSLRRAASLRYSPPHRRRPSNALWADAGRCDCTWLVVLQIC